MDREIFQLFLENPSLFSSISHLSFGTRRMIILTVNRIMIATKSETSEAIFGIMRMDPSRSAFTMLESTKKRLDNSAIPMKRTPVAKGIK